MELNVSLEKSFLFKEIGFSEVRELRNIIIEMCTVKFMVLQNGLIDSAFFEVSRLFL